MFGRRYFGKRYYGAHYFGPRADQTLSPTGFANANAIGAPVISVGAFTIRPASIANANAFGAPTLSAGAVTLALIGFVDADHVGSHRLIPGPVTLSLAGFVNVNHFGGPVLQAVKKNGSGGGGTGGGVAKGQKYGTKITMTESGLIVAIEVNANTGKTVNTRIGIYSDGAGLPANLLAQSGIKTSTVTGANRYDLLVPVSVPTGTALWPTLHSDGNFSWFLATGPSSRFNADVFADGLSNPFGASTLQNNKAPIVIVFLESITLTLQPAGFANQNAFGSPKFNPKLAPSGFADADAFGGIALSERIALPSIVDADAFGSPSLSPGAVTLSLTGIGSTSTIGSPVLNRDPDPVYIRPTGFVDADAFGSLTLSPQPVSLTLTGFVDADAFSGATLTPSQTIRPTGIASSSAIGSLSLVVSSVTVALTGFADDDGIGSPVLTQPDIGLTGFSDGDAFGNPIFSAAVPLEPNSQWLLEYLRRPIRKLEYETPRELEPRESERELA